ncbi:hypothetical protein [Pantoea ananatis]|uniref:hypothetical protein n=1 Tax=Pantoea ananas TaxID=553 RepID=UPI000CF4104B|nr:hypothetical protein [Pantoea ananatis]PQL06099.1 hypothetical protein CG436_18705 [Pantoea ananatis]
MTTTLFFTFLGPALVLLGWKVVFFNAQRIATRNETKSIVDSSVKLLNEIAELSVNYWVPKDDGSDNYRKYLLNVLAKSSQLQRYINILENRGVSLDMGLLSSIADDATLDAEYVSLQNDSEREVKAQSIVESCMMGVLHIFQKFEQTYPPIREFTMYEFFSWYDESYYSKESTSNQLA